VTLTAASPLRSTPAEWAEARWLVNRHGFNATAYQILNPGIERWFSPRHAAVVGFVTSFGYRVVAGSPVCSEEDLSAVVEDFEDETHRRGLVSCYFAADERLAQMLAWRGPLDRVLLGAQPVWHPSSWPAVLERKASLRAQLYRARNKGVEVESWDVERATGNLEIHHCLEEWLRTRGLPPLHFLVEPETLERLHDRQIFVALREGRVVGFLVASPIPTRNGWLIEQLIRGEGAANGTTELLLDAAMTAMERADVSYVTLGLSPLSSRAPVDHPHQVWWMRALLTWMRAHARRFYNFEGLDAFKAKFLPDSWEPIYAITSERRVGLGTLYAIAGAFGSMSPPELVARSLGRAALQELRWVHERLRSDRASPRLGHP
jgi:phosphatidylglycerol lysyltransferase